MTQLGSVGVRLQDPASSGSEFIVSLPLVGCAPNASASAVLIVTADGAVQIPVGNLYVNNGIIYATDVQIANGWSLYNVVSGLIAGVTALAVLNIVLLCHVFSTSSSVSPPAPETKNKALARV